MKENTTVAIFKTHHEAEEAVRQLQRAGFDMKQLSIVGKDFETDEQVVGFYNTGERVKYWGKMGAFWGGLWGLLLGAAFFWVPGVGLVAVGGPIVTWIVGALETAAVAGGLSALGAALYSIGIPKDSVVNYETAIKAGKFMLVAHGTAGEVGRARELLRDSGAEELAVHPAAEAAAGD
jgi:uncharacterized membrane protein